MNYPAPTIRFYDADFANQIFCVDSEWYKTAWMDENGFLESFSLPFLPTAILQLKRASGIIVANIKYKILFYSQKTNNSVLIFQVYPLDYVV